MNQKIPFSINWFFPYLKNLEIFKDISLQEIFKYSTEELIQKYKTSQDITLLLLAERFLWEHIEKNFISYKLLIPVLEKREVPGYVFYFPNKNFWEKNKEIFSQFTFIKIDENYYFYPSEWGNILNIFVYLWKKGIRFFSAEIQLNRETQIKSIKNYIEFAKILDFSYLSQKAQRSLKDYLPTLETGKLQEVIKKFLKLPDSVLLLASKNKVKKDLEKEKIKIIKVFEEKNILFLLKCSDLKQLISLFEKNSESNKIGILSKKVWKKYAKKGLSPLILLIGAFEHAKRVNNIKVKIFEGFTYHVIGDLYYEWKDFGKALKYYLIAKDYTKQPIELALSKSAIYYTFGDFDKAEKILKQELCGYKREDPFIHYNLGLIYLKKKKNEKAKYHFYKAHLLDPENSIFREALMNCLWNLREYKELEDFLYSLKNLSTKEKIYLGKLYFYKKKYEKAFKYLKENLTLKEKDGESLLFLAWLYLYFNKEKEVSEILLKEAENILSSEKIKKIKEEFGLEIK